MKTCIEYGAGVIAFAIGTNENCADRISFADNL